MANNELETPRLEGLEADSEEPITRATDLGEVGEGTVLAMVVGYSGGRLEEARRHLLELGDGTRFSLNPADDPTIKMYVRIELGLEDDEPVTRAMMNYFISRVRGND